MTPFIPKNGNNKIQRQSKSSEQSFKVEELSLPRDLYFFAYISCDTISERLAQSAFYIASKPSIFSSRV